MTVDKLCLGRVKSVEKFHLDVCLPLGRLGRIKIADVSSTYRTALEKFISAGCGEDVRMLKDMFSVGEIVRCAIKSDKSGSSIADTERRSIADLTLEPAVINRNIAKSHINSSVVFSGAICGLEDKGYILETGLGNLKAFLPFEEVTPLERQTFCIGKVLSFRISHNSKLDNRSRVVRVTTKFGNEKSMVAPNKDNICFENLLPGMLIRVKILGSSHFELNASIDSFEVSIPLTHLPKPSKAYEKNSLHTACIISTDPASKELLASLLPHLTYDATKNAVDVLYSVNVGAKFADAQIQYTEQHFAVLCLPSANNSRAILKKIHAFDGKPPKNWATKLPGNEPIRCRVIDLNLFENVAIVSRKTSVFESRYLSISDVKPGSTISVTVRKLSKTGVLVRLAGKIRGLIPFMHLSDVPFKKPEERFKPNYQLKARVLYIDLENQRLVLTAKKSIVDAVDLIFGSTKMLKAWATSCNQQKSAEKPETENDKILIVTAFVVFTSEKGVLVAGVNNIRGWIPRGETYVADSPSIEEFFTRGQTLRCRVLRSLDRAKSEKKSKSSQFLLSQKLDPKKIESVLQPNISSSVAVGEVYYAQIKDVFATGLRVNLLTSKKPPTPLSKLKIVTEAELAFWHLTDSPEIAGLLGHFGLSLFVKGTLLAWSTDEPCRVVVTEISTTHVSVSAKPSLVSVALTAYSATLDGLGASGFVQTFDQLTVGSQWLGWIAHHKDYGVFVQFPGGFRGLAPTRYLTDRRAPPKTDWTLVYPLGATVEAKVVEIGVPEKKRCLVSLRMLDVYADAAQQYVSMAIATTRHILLQTQWLCQHGTQVYFTVSELNEESVSGSVTLVIGTQSVPGVAFLANTAEVECTVGNTYPGVVTTVILSGSGLVEVCLLPWLVKGVASRVARPSALGMEVRVGQTVSSSCISLGGSASDFIIVGLQMHALGRLAVLPARRCFNDVLGGNAWTLGQTNRVTIRGEFSPKQSSNLHPLLATLSIYDPISSSKKPFARVFEDAPVNLVAGAVLPTVLFLGLKGRIAFFRLPSSRGIQGSMVRLFCRVINAVGTAKAARKFVKSPPEVGTVFKDAVVLQAAVEDKVSRKGKRLPLSTCLTEISILKKQELSVGDLVCGQFAAEGPLCWRLVLPCGATGLLHVSCMSNAEKKATITGNLRIPNAPKHGTWITCRIIGLASKSHSQKSNQKGNFKDNTALGPEFHDTIVPLEDNEDESVKPRGHRFFVTTDVSDIQRFDPDRYKTLHLEEDAVYNGYVKKVRKSSLIVSLSYNVDVTVPYASQNVRKRLGVCSSRYRVGSAVQVKVTAVKSGTGQLVTDTCVQYPEPKAADIESVVIASNIVSSPVNKRKRTMSCGSTGDSKAGTISPNGKRRRLSSLHTLDSSESSTLGCHLRESLLSRFADFMPPANTSNEHRRLASSTVGVIDVTDVSGDKATAEGELVDSLELESRLAAVAQATASGNVGDETAIQMLHLASVEEFEVAVRNAPSNPHLWTRYMAWLHLDQAREADARRVRDRGLAHAAGMMPSMLSGSFTGSLLLSALGLEVKTAVSVDATNSTTTTTTVSEKIHTDLESVIAKINQLDREAVIRKAIDVLSNAGFHKHAEEMARKLVKKSSMNADAWLALIKARFRAGQVAAAREAQRNAARLIRLVHLPHLSIECARLELELGDTDRAMNLLDELLTAHPRRKVVYIEYINLLISAGKLQEAKAIRLKALEKLSTRDHESVNKQFSETNILLE